MRYARNGQGLTPLGMIPAWQFSEDPAVNPTKINPHVKYPPGMYQTTPQPAYPYYQGPEGTEGEGLKGVSDLVCAPMGWGQKFLWAAIGAGGVFAYNFFFGRRR